MSLLVVTHPLILFQVCRDVLALSRNRYIVKFPLFFGEQLEPPILCLLDNLRNTEGQRSHEVIGGGPKEINVVHQ